jgi:hypothetical protein
MRQDVIQEFISLYQRVGPYLPIEPYLVDEAVRSYLTSIHAIDDFPSLQAAYSDLENNQGQSPFFHDAVAYNAPFLYDQSTSQRLLEEAQRIRWEEIKSPGVKQASKGLSMSMHCSCLKWRIDGGELVKVREQQLSNNT